MPRIPRGETSNSILHVLNRGVERRPIFSKAQDYGFFLTQARELFSGAGISLLSFCLMPNHYHFLVQVAGGMLSRAMQNLQARHSMYFNRVHERVGHLFQDRFKAFEVDDADYLGWLPVYIHRNPVKAGLVSRPEQWEWSGHGEMVSSSSRYLDLSQLKSLGYDADKFRARYLEQLAEFDRPLARAASLEEILQWSARNCGIRWQDIRDGARGGPFTQAKLTLLREAQARGYAHTDVAGILRCTPAAISDLLANATKEKGQTF